jgi:amino-acid N-acetyltransferase
MNDLIIRQASADDLSAIEALLKLESLPREGVAEHIHHFLVAERGGKIIGAIGLEAYGDTGLLRSAVVVADLRNTGIGSMLYNHNLEQAQRLGIRRLLLLTNTAEQYFARKGFRTIDQKNVSGAVTTSVEFSGACPAHAVCMELML